MIPKRKTLTPAPAKAVAAMAAASDDVEEDVDLSSLEAIDLSAQDILEVVDIAKSSTIKKKVAEPVTSAIELSDGDYLLLTPSPIAVPIPSVVPSAEQSKSNLRAALAEVKPPPEKKAPSASTKASSVVPVASPVKKRPPMGLSWEEEADVAETCLASIAEETARVRGSDPFLKIAPPPTGPIAPPSVEELGDADILREALPTSSRRLPPINPPPFIVRKEPLPAAARSSSTLLTSSSSASSLRSTTPSSPFARTSSDSLSSASDLSTLPIGVRTPFARTFTDTEHADRVSSPSFPVSVRPPTKSGSSFPPLSMDSTRDLPPGAPAIVNPRGRGATTTRAYRPRTAWILGSAIVGLFGAVIATKMIDPSSPPEPTAPAAQAIPSTPVVAPTESTRTIVFKENEGVSIPATPPPAPKPAVVVAAPQPVKPAAVAPKPAWAPPPRPTAQPKVSAPTPLVDGTLGMGNNKPSTTIAAPAKPASTPDPTPARKKPLTPEQELAEAQLKAAMK